MIRQQIANASTPLGSELSRREELRERFNRWLLDELAPLADRYRETVRDYIAARVKAWSADELTDQLELSIGSDLQWIRYNGTPVGAAIGGLLYGLALGVRICWSGEHPLAAHGLGASCMRNRYWRRSRIGALTYGRDAGASDAKVQGLL